MIAQSTHYFDLRDDEFVCHCCQQLQAKSNMIDCNVCGHFICQSGDCITRDHLCTQANVCTDCLLDHEKMMRYYAAELRKAEEISAAKSMMINSMRLLSSGKILAAAARLMEDAK